MKLYVRQREIAAVGLVLLVASALRGYGLTWQALSGDEAFSVLVSAAPLNEILRLMGHGEPHPPLHFLLLKIWMQLAGNSELAVRWPSLLASVVTVALTYRLGCTLIGRPGGRLAAWLAAFSPFLIWYSQDGRMYSFVTALVLAATWQTWRAARRPDRRHWLLAGTLWWLALLTHYFAALPFASVLAALWLAPQTRFRWRQGMALALGVGLAYLPWVIFVGPNLAGEKKDWFPTQAAWRLLTAFSVGTASAGATGEAQWIGNVSSIALLVAGIGALLRRRARTAIWLLCLSLGVPVMFWSVTLVNAAFAERYAISALPAALIIAAAGALELRKVKRWGLWLGRALVAAWALAALISLQNHFFNPVYAKSPNWRGFTAYLAETARPDEIVLLNLPDPAFTYYYHAPMPAEPSPPGPFAQVGPAATEVQLVRVRDAFQHIRFYFAPSSAYDPEGFVGRWLEACCEKLSDTFVYGFRMQAFDTPSGSLAARVPYLTQFGDGLSLTGYRVVNPAVRAGDIIHLTLFWAAKTPTTASYTVFVHFLAADGFDLVDADSQPAGGRRPTDQWRQGEGIIDPHLIPVPADAPPGEYGIEVGLYQVSTGERLSLVEATDAGAGADAVKLPVTVRVANP